MKRIKRLLAVAALGSIASASSAFALTQTIDFALGYPKVTQFAPSFTYSGILGSTTLVITPWAESPGHIQQASAPTSVVTRTWNYPAGNPKEDKNAGGIGVLSPATGKTHDINADLKSGDLAQFKFSHAVRLVSVEFSRVDSNDNFDFFMGGLYQFTKNIPNRTINNIYHTYSFALNTVSNVFGFGTLFVTPKGYVCEGETKCDVGSNYKVRSITVSAVPLPPALLLFATGLLGVGSLGRRRRKAL